MHSLRNRADALAHIVRRTDADENPCAELCAELDALLRDGEPGAAVAAFARDVLFQKARRMDVRLCLVVWVKCRTECPLRTYERRYISSILPQRVVGALFGSARPRT